MGGNLYGDGGILEGSAEVFRKGLQILGIGQKKNPRVQYTSLSGKKFKTKEEAAKDNADLTNSRGIYAPQDVKISVKAGDSLWKIAKDNHTDLDTIYKYNPQYKNNSLIHIGDEIIIGKKTGASLHNIRDQWNKEKAINQDNLRAIQSIKHDDNYIVIDKKNKGLTVYNRDNKAIYQTNDISTGLSGNDYNTITYVDEKGHIISNKGNESTPAGITKITGVGTYHGYPSFTRGRKSTTYNNDSYEDIASSLHFGSTKDAKSSNGCVRVGGDTLKQLSKYIATGTNVYTLPEKGGSRFISKDGKLNFVADNPYGSNEGSHKYWDDYNVQLDKSYSKLVIKPKTKGNSLYKETEKKYLNAITTGKKALMDKFNLDSDTYNHLAELALGIAQQETKYGTANRKMLKDLVPDLALNVLRGNTNRSRGLTQIKIKGDNKGMQKIYKDLGITEDSLDRADVGAVATMARLAYMYNTEVKGRKFKGAHTDISPFDALLYKWMGRNDQLTNKTATPENNAYINNVKKYARNYDLYSIR